MPSGPERARAAFRVYAAGQVKVDPSEVEVREFAPNRSGPARLGSLWQLTAYGPRRDVQGDRGPARQIVGWADEDGHVVTPETDLPRLLREAGLFSDQPPTATELVNLLLLPYVGLRQLHLDPHRGAPAPELKRTGEGRWELVFVARVLSPVPGPAPERYERFELVVESETQATLSVTPWVPGS